MADQPSPLLRYFTYAHLPPHLQSTSKIFADAAGALEDLLPAGPEKTTALRKLLESKDCAVRAALDLEAPLGHGARVASLDDVVVGKTYVYIGMSPSRDVVVVSKGEVNAVEVARADDPKAITDWVNLGNLREKS